MVKKIINKYLAILVTFLLIFISGVSISGNIEQQKLNVLSNTKIVQGNKLNDLLFDFAVSYLMGHLNFPGMSACIIKKDDVSKKNEVIWFNSYGYRDIENKKPAMENTVYFLASLTKTITATALMQLWEQDLFDLDEDVNNYLPFSLRNPNFPDVPITFRMLLTHRSSLNEEYFGEGYYRLNFSGDPPFSWYPYPWLQEHLVPGGKWYYPERWCTSPPGETGIYANVNFDIIAYLVECVSSLSFIDYCDRYIFDPLEMHNTSFNLSEFDIDNVAIPYHNHDGEYIHINELSYLYGIDGIPPGIYYRIQSYPAGGLYSTVIDLSHFFIAHMNGGVWNNVRILEEETVEEMHRIQPPSSSIGFGWITGNLPFFPDNATFCGNKGDSYGAFSWMNYYLNKNIGLIICANGGMYYEKHEFRSIISFFIFLRLLYSK